jgi:hypothetical protein
MKLERSSNIPVNVAELVLAQSALQADGDVERSAGRNGTPDTRHRDDGDILDLNVCGWLGNEHEALIQAVK